MMCNLNNINARIIRKCLPADPHLSFSSHFKESLKLWGFQFDLLVRIISEIDESLWCVLTAWFIQVETERSALSVTIFSKREIVLEIPHYPWTLYPQIRRQRSDLHTVVFRCASITFDIAIWHYFISTMAREADLFVFELKSWPEASKLMWRWSEREAVSHCITQWRQGAIS